MKAYFVDNQYVCGYETRRCRALNMKRDNLPLMNMEWGRGTLCYDLNFSKRRKWVNAMLPFRKQIVRKGNISKGFMQSLKRCAVSKLRGCCVCLVSGLQLFRELFVHASGSFSTVAHG